MEALLANSHQKNVHSVLLHNAHQQAAQLSTEREALNQQNQQLSEQNSQLRAALYSVLRNQLDSSFPDVAGVAPPPWRDARQCCCGHLRAAATSPATTATRRRRRN